LSADLNHNIPKNMLLF